MSNSGTIQKQGYKLLSIDAVAEMKPESIIKSNGTPKKVDASPSASIKRTPKGKRSPTPVKETAGSREAKSVTQAGNDSLKAKKIIELIDKNNRKAPSIGDVKAVQENPEPSVAGKIVENIAIDNVDSKDFHWAVPSPIRSQIPPKKRGTPSERAAMAEQKIPNDEIASPTGASFTFSNNTPAKQIDRNLKRLSVSPSSSSEENTFAFKKPKECDSFSMGGFSERKEPSFDFEMKDDEENQNDFAFDFNSPGVAIVASFLFEMIFELIYF